MPQRKRYEENWKPEDSTMRCTGVSLSLCAQRTPRTSPVEALGIKQQGAPRCMWQTTALLKMLRPFGVNIILLDLTSLELGEFKAWAWFTISFERDQQVINTQTPELSGKVP